MSAYDASAKVEHALANENPLQKLLVVAGQLRDEGMHQQELIDVLDFFGTRHQADVEETRYNAILDALDSVAGFCPPSRKIYP